jgi:hypothetical protein
MDPFQSSKIDNVFVGLAASVSAAFEASKAMEASAAAARMRDNRRSERPASLRVKQRANVMVRDLGKRVSTIGRGASLRVRKSRSVGRTAAEGSAKQAETEERFSWKKTLSLRRRKKMNVDKEEKGESEEMVDWLERHGQETVNEEKKKKNKSRKFTLPKMKKPKKVSGGEKRLEPPKNCCPIS